MLIERDQDEEAKEVAKSQQRNCRKWRSRSKRRFGRRQRSRKTWLAVDTVRAPDLHIMCAQAAHAIKGCFFSDSSSGTELLWACFWTSGVPKGFFVTQRLGTNYFCVRNTHCRVWKKEKFMMCWFEGNIQGVITLKSADLELFLESDNLPASFLNLFMSVSYQKVICAQSWDHKETFKDPYVQNQAYTELPHQSNFSQKVRIWPFLENWGPNWDDFACFL